MSGVTLVSLKSCHNKKFLRHEVEKGEYQGHLLAAGDEKLNPLSIFAIEESESARDLVHVRSCYNNKYLVRNGLDGGRIVVGANEKEEDQSKWNCTLFKAISTEVNEGDTKHKAVKFQHLHSEEYVYLCQGNNNTANAFAGFPKTSAMVLGDLSHTFRAIPITATERLPKYIVFKGDNDKYLKADSDISGALCFRGTDIAENGVANEIHNFEHHILIKNLETGKHWRAGGYDYCSSIGNCVPLLVFADGLVNDSSDAVKFVATNLELPVTTLKSLFTNKFCGREASLSEFMMPDRKSMNRSTELTMEEYVVKRRITDVVYDFDNVRMYDVQDVDVITRTYKNYGTSSQTYTLDVEYKHSKTSRWDASVSLKLGVKTEIKANFAFIVKSKVELSGEFSGGYKWGGDEAQELTLKDSLPVTVPGGAMRKASCVAKKGKCDIPFTYYQRDLLYNGEWISKTLSDGIYTGANHFDFQFVAGPELPVPPQE